MKLEYLRKRWSEFPDRVAVVDNYQVPGLFHDSDAMQITFAYLMSEFNRFAEFYAGRQRSPYVDLTWEGWQSIARLLALIETGYVVSIGAGNKASMIEPSHPLLGHLGDLGHPGLVLFTSGSTGQPKAVLHDFTKILKKFEEPRPARRMLLFMRPDHIGGINTLFHSLYNGGALILPKDRSPDTICRAIERFSVQVLPTTPTFLNLMVLSGAHEHYNLHSLETITYGTEPMPQGTLDRLRAALPKVALKQTYGSTEIGILRSRSREDGSLWMRLGGDGFETRVRDGMLEVKAESSMLGYLNAPSPFTADGWFRTGDLVEVDGEFYRIIGRRSETINVGGEKVHPSEVEGLLEALPNVAAALVCAEQHPLTGQIVCAQVELKEPEAIEAFNARMREALTGKVPPHKIPQKVTLAETSIMNERGKKSRVRV